MASIPHLDGLRQVADRYDAFLLDIFGLLHNGIDLYQGTLECLERLNAAGKKICLLSNTPRLPDNVRADLLLKGLAPNLYHHIVTAGLSARLDLEARHAGEKIWFTGKDEFTGFIENMNLVRVTDPLDASLIVNAVSGLTPQNDGPLYEQLTAALARNKPMLCANPDMVVHIGSELYLCGGTYAAWYEERGGAVTYHGKPHHAVYQLALELLGHPARVCALGDALHTDIQGANAMNLDSIWVLSGIHWKELRLTARPTHPDLDRVAETLTMSLYKPTATLTEFRW